MTRSDLILTKAVSLMEGDLENEVRILEMAQKLGISARGLERKFARTFGVSPSGFLCDLRLDKALRLISSTDMRLTDLALRCGLNNATNLSKLFRKRFDKTPTVRRRIWLH
ncbi:MAG: helix-turn-helix domain-containing protein [Cypionkella sp.]